MQPISNDLLYTLQHILRIAGCFMLNNILQLEQVCGALFRNLIWSIFIKKKNHRSLECECVSHKMSPWIDRNCYSKDSLIKQALLGLSSISCILLRGKRPKIPQQLRLRSPSHFLRTSLLSQCYLKKKTYFWDTFCM